MRALLAELGDPQRAFPAVHVVGTNGKTTTTRMIEALLSAERLRVGAFTSPHVVSWGERIRVGGREADFDAAIGRVRGAAESVGATQFEVLTAAALAEFAATGVDVAVVEAGLGGRLDATNVLRAPVVVLTNVALEHTDHLGETREAIAAEKLAVVDTGATVILGEPDWEPLAREHGAGRVVVVSASNLALAVAAATEFVGGPVDPGGAEGVEVPGRLERVDEHPLEIWDGAHNLAAVGYALPRLPRRESGYVLVVSILADKDAVGMLAAFSVLGRRLVATSSGHARALPPDDLAGLARPYFDEVEVVADPAEARERARALAGPDGAVLVSGSLYLLLSLADVRSGYVPWDASASE
jgi:dihydrofolate synthase/folylpolyglutamate synthase